MMQNATLNCNAKKLSKKVELYSYFLNKKIERNIQKYSFEDNFVSFISSYESYKKDEKDLNLLKNSKTKKSNKVVKLV